MYNNVSNTQLWKLLYIVSCLLYFFLIRHTLKVLVKNFGLQGDYLHDIHDFPQSVQTKARTVLQLGRIRFRQDRPSLSRVTAVAR
jgi:hypothetical protein